MSASDRRRAGVVSPGWRPEARGPEGRGLCRACLTEVPRDRRTWCSQVCVDRHLSAIAPRRLIRLRDRGICASCGLDTEALEHELAALRRARYHDEAALRAWRDRWDELAHRGFTRGLSLWQADHVVPIVEGGEFEPSNLRTLCVPCHKRETAALAARLAAARRPPAPESSQLEMLAGDAP